MTRFPAVGGGDEKPFMLGDSAETFAESDVSISGTQFEINNEAINISPITENSSSGFIDSPGSRTVS